MFPFVGITLIPILAHAPILLIGAVTQGALAAAAVRISDIAASGGITTSWRWDFFFAASSADQGQRADKGEKEQGLQGLFWHGFHCEEKGELMVLLKSYGSEGTMKMIGTNIFLPSENIYSS